MTPIILVFVEIQPSQVWSKGNLSEEKKSELLKKTVSTEDSHKKKSIVLKWRDQIVIRRYVVLDTIKWVVL